jgi:hypothetical protein
MGGWGDGEERQRARLEKGSEQDWKKAASKMLALLEKRRECERLAPWILKFPSSIG